jgi:hypothetical protein
VFDLVTARPGYPFYRGKRYEDWALDDPAGK